MDMQLRLLELTYLKWYTQFHSGYYSTNCFAHVGAEVQTNTPVSQHPNTYITVDFHT